MLYCFSFRSDTASGSHNKLCGKRVTYFNRFFCIFADAKKDDADRAGQAAPEERDKEPEEDQEGQEEAAEGATGGDPLDIAGEVEVEAGDEGEGEQDEEDDDDEEEEEYDPEEDEYLNKFINKDAPVRPGHQAGHIRSSGSELVLTISLFVGAETSRQAA